MVEHTSTEMVGCSRGAATSALVRPVESLPVHTQTHGGRSGHFNLSARHLPPKEVAEKTPKRVVRSHGRGHRCMLQQSHAGRRDGCSNASRSAVGLRNWCVCTSKCIVLLHCHPAFSLFILIFLIVCLDKTQYSKTLGTASARGKSTQAQKMHWE